MTETDLAELRAQVGRVQEISPGRLDIIDHPQFSLADAVAAVDGLGMARLQQWIAQGWLPLSTTSPGQGRRRLITGADMLLINATMMLSPWLPVEVAQYLHKLIRDRAFELLTSTDLRRRNVFYLHPLGLGRWMVHQDYEDGGPSFLDRAKLPVRSVRFDVDGLILETIPSLLKIVSGASVDASLKHLPPMSRDSDDLGRPVLAGLTFEESQEYRRLQDLDFASRLSATRPPQTAESDAAAARLIDLYDKHETARLRRIGSSGPARREAQPAPPPEPSKPAVKKRAVGTKRKRKGKA